MTWLICAIPAHTTSYSYDGQTLTNDGTWATAGSTAVYSTNRLPLHPGFLCISEKCGCPLDGNEKKAYNQCIS